MSKTPHSTKPSHLGGYHTVFRSVKPLTFQINAEIVKFSTGLLASKLKMRLAQLRLRHPPSKRFGDGKDSIDLENRFRTGSRKANRQSGRDGRVWVLAAAQLTAIKGVRLAEEPRLEAFVAVAVLNSKAEPLSPSTPREKPVACYQRTQNGCP
jgi:hypothetical protein